MLVINQLKLGNCQDGTVVCLLKINLFNLKQVSITENCFSLTFLLRDMAAYVATADCRRVPDYLGTSQGSIVYVCRSHCFVSWVYYLHIRESFIAQAGWYKKCCQTKTYWSHWGGKYILIETVKLPAAGRERLFGHLCPRGSGFGDAFEIGSQATLFKSLTQCVIAVDVPAGCWVQKWQAGSCWVPLSTWFTALRSNVCVLSWQL